MQQQLARQGYTARCVHIVNGSLVQEPIQRNNREEAEAVKQGSMPSEWKPHKRAQNAAVADSAVFESLLDASNTSRNVYADCGYPSIEREANLTQAGWRVHAASRERLETSARSCPR